MEQNMSLVEVFSMEMPNAIALVKARQPQVQQLVALATREQLKRAGIRKCKKLASSLRVRNLLFCLTDGNYAKNFDGP